MATPEIVAAASRVLGALPDPVRRVVVVVHYLAEQVEQYLRSQRHFRDWAVVPQQQPRGTGDALRQCRAQLQSEHFLVLNGDDLFGAKDLRALARQPAGLLCTEVEEPRRFGIAYLKGDGTLEKLVEKPDLPPPQLANTGAYVFPREVFDIEIGLSPRGEYEIGTYTEDGSIVAHVAVSDGRTPDDRTEDEREDAALDQVRRLIKALESALAEA